MPIDCTKCQICGVYRKKVIWEFAGGKSKFAHAFFETLKKFFFGSSLKKAANLRDPNFFFIMFNRFEDFYDIFRISISILFLLKLQINDPEKYPLINALTDAIAF